MDVLSRSIEASRTAADTGGARATATAADPDDQQDTRTSSSRRRGAERAKPARSRASAAQPKGTGAKKSTSSRQPAAVSATGKKRAAAKKNTDQDLAALTKAELYRMATEQEIPHRSTMTRDELQKALQGSRAKGRHLHAAS